MTKNALDKPARSFFLTIVSNSVRTYDIGKARGIPISQLENAVAFNNCELRIVDAGAGERVVPGTL